VIICSCDNHSVVCPAHCHKKCPRNTNNNGNKCSADKKSMLVWASTEELNDLKKRMHSLMKKHKQEQGEEVGGKIVYTVEDDEDNK
jgi:hypothetical protein